MDKVRLHKSLVTPELTEFINKQSKLPSDTLHLKYPRTYHLPYSEGTTNDDKKLESDEYFRGKYVIITEKLDGENCLDGDSLVTTTDGVVSIRDICENNLTPEVLSYNVETRDIEIDNVINTLISESSENDVWYEIESDSGEVLRLTGDHYVFVPLICAYRKVKDLKEGDDILPLN